ncbi:MAG: sensor histidine kinase [Acidobacteria bacterium]|nr:sensor histidine kinase [Acidobacteriota bacterium]
MIGSYRLLNRLGALESPGEALQVERVLATGRAFLAITALVAIYVDPVQPRLATAAYALLVGYLAYSTIILLMFRSRTRFEPGLRRLVHAADIFWPTVITLFTEGPNSPYYLFFIFVLLAAAYRWGFPETLGTAVLAVALLMGEVALFERFDPSGSLGGNLALNRFLIRSGYLLILGFLLGYLAETEKRLRGQLALVPRMLGKARAELGLRGTLQGVLNDMLHVFAARHAVFAVQETSSGRVFVWHSGRESAAEGQLRYSEVEADGLGAYMFRTQAHTFHVLRSRSGTTSADAVAVDVDGRRISDSIQVPASFQRLHPFRSLLGAWFAFGEEWQGRIFLVDPAGGSDRESTLRFLQNLMRQTGPAIYNVYLTRRMRSRAGAAERARMARELHDGTIQSLVAAEMRLEVLRRKGAGERAAEELAEIQQIVHHEILNLRELMRQMRPVEVDPRKLLEFLANMVDKFRRETGIAATFHSDQPDLALPVNVSREVARLVQEALMNVLKHSDAHRVLVRLSSQDGTCKLVVDDDGRGFDFVGRLTQAELDAAHKGPLVIRERVRSIRGQLTIESYPGRGARLEITFPQEAYD